MSSIHKWRSRLQETDMHSLVFVLIPSTAQDIKADVLRLLAGSDDDPTKLFQQYQAPCGCIGFKASSDSYHIFESTSEGADLLLRLANARASHDRTTEEQLLLQRFIASRAIAKEHPAYRQPDLECELCHGTGSALESRDPKSQWDYWIIGGRWSGLFTDLPSQDNDDEELQTNIARVRDIPDHIVPAAILTAEGDWYAGAIVMEDELFEAHRDKEELHSRQHWAQETRSLLSRYSDYLAIVVDCHS
jgi:hypothetical protein